MFEFIQSPAVLALLAFFALLFICKWVFSWIFGIDDLRKVNQNILIELKKLNAKEVTE